MLIVQLRYVCYFSIVTFRTTLCFAVKIYKYASILECIGLRCAIYHLSLNVRLL